jgi:hypothetical protein
MRIQTSPSVWALALLALFSAPDLGTAYYDAGVQRWISRDPTGEVGFESGSRSSVSEVNEDVNWFRFVGNEAVSSMDSWGLSLVSVITGIFDKWGYGNSCGWSRRGQNGPPVDEVDAACAWHDECLARPCDAWKLAPCNDTFCRAVGAADCSRSPDPGACRRAKRDISIACNLVGSGLHNTIGIVIGIFR